MAYASWDDVLVYLPDLADEAGAEAAFEPLLARASELIDSELGFSFDGYAEGENRVVYADHSPYLDLPIHRVGSVTSVATMGGTELTDWQELDDGRLYAINDNGFEWNWASDRDAMAANPACLPYPYGYGAALAQQRKRVAYTVTGDWGYGDAPELLVRATVELASRLYEGIEGEGVESFRLSDGTQMKFWARRDGTWQDLVAQVKTQYSTSQTPLGALL